MCLSDTMSRVISSVGQTLVHNITQVEIITKYYHWLQPPYVFFFFFFFWEPSSKYVRTEGGRVPNQCVRLIQRALYGWPLTSKIHVEQQHYAIKIRRLDFTIPRRLWTSLRQTWCVPGTHLRLQNKKVDVKFKRSMAVTKWSSNGRPL